MIRRLVFWRYAQPPVIRIEVVCQCCAPARHQREYPAKGLFIMACGGDRSNVARGRVVSRAFCRRNGIWCDIIMMESRMAASGRHAGVCLLRLLKVLKALRISRGIVPFWTARKVKGLESVGKDRETASVPEGG